jgi:hypothetical protein
MNRKTIIIVFVIITILILVTVAYLIMNRTTVYVDPQTIKEPVNQNFQINITVSNVANLYGWYFKLGWNATILSLVNVTEGPFLKSIHQTIFSYKLNQTSYHYVVDCSYMGDVSGANGTGVLATIRFHVNEAGNCTLNLYDTELLDPSGKDINHITNVGHFTTQAAS